MKTVTLRLDEDLDLAIRRLARRMRRSRREIARDALRQQLMPPNIKGLDEAPIPFARARALARAATRLDRLA